MKCAPASATGMQQPSTKDSAAADHALVTARTRSVHRGENPDGVDTCSARREIAWPWSIRSKGGFHLDHRLIEFANSLPPQWKIRGLTEKHILRRAVADLLPESILQRTKQPYRAPDCSSFFNDGVPLDYVPTCSVKSVSATPATLMRHACRVCLKNADPVGSVDLPTTRPLWVFFPRCCSTISLSAGKHSDPTENQPLESRFPCQSKPRSAITSSRKSHVHR